MGARLSSTVSQGLEDDHSGAAHASGCGVYSISDPKKQLENKANTPDSETSFPSLSEMLPADCEKNSRKRKRVNVFPKYLASDGDIFADASKDDEPTDHKKHLRSTEVDKSSQLVNFLLSNQDTSALDLWDQVLSSHALDAASEVPKVQLKPKTLHNTMTLSERKYFLVFTPSSEITSRMNKIVSDIYAPFHRCQESICWLRPSPARRQSNTRAAGSLQFDFKRRTSSDRQFLKVNFGILALIVTNCLTDSQAEGYVNQAWQVGRLCGNCACCNWRHFTVEPQPLSVSRSRCFKSSGPCYHKPPCMRDRKILCSPKPRVLSGKKEVRCAE